MLHYWYLTFRVLFFSLFKKKIDQETAIRLKFFVMPWVCDDFLTMQAGMYFSYTDAGRWEIATRTGFGSYLRRHSIYIYVAGQKVVYFKSIPNLSFFTLDIKVIGHDKDWIYVAQAFRHRGQLSAYILTKLALVQKSKKVSPTEKLIEAGIEPLESGHPLILEFKNDKELKELVEEYLS